MKSAVKRMMTNLYAISPDQVIASIEKADCKVVSFDIFDTLIKRNVPTPQDVFLLLEKRYQQYYGGSMPVCALRSQAEERAAKHLGRIEVSLSEIYQAMEEISEAEREWLMEEEIHIEQAVCQCWQPMGRVYDWCLSKGIPVILVSDMYLSRDMITDLLHAAGYSDWKRLYISAEEHGNKAHGTLFDIVLREEHLKPKELLHIGDSLRGDYLAPKGKGIQTILIVEKSRHWYCNKKELHSEKKQGRLSYQIIDSVVKNNICQYDDYFQRLGYNVVGPILYGYCKWLANEVKQADIEKIFFLAREGYLLKRCFDFYTAQQMPCSVIEVSRYATALPRLYHAKNLDELLQMVSLERAGVTVKMLMLVCGINEQSIRKITNDIGIQPDENLEAISDEKKEDLFRTAKPLIDAQSREQERCFHGYISQIGSGKRIAVCDVGWHGTIQGALQKIIPNVDMIGYYIGRIARNAKQDVDLEAYLFDEERNPDIARCVIGTLDLFELFFLSTEGSARGYVQDENGQYRCAKFPAEQTKDSAQKIIALQDAAFSFVCKMMQVDHYLGTVVNPGASGAAYCSFVKHIDRQTIRELSQFSFLNIGKRSLTAEHSLGWYLLKPREFLHDFLNNGSKVLFLKSIFRVPLPYVQIVDFLRRADMKRKGEG